MSTFIEKEGVRNAVIFSVQLATFSEILSLPSTVFWELKQPERKLYLVSKCVCQTGQG
jgi:hypothetical protein